jgi:hypothetical protein
MKNRSGQLLAVNDVYIEKLISDPLYDIKANGTIWSLVSLQGKITTTWRQAGQVCKQGYRRLSYGPRHDRKHLRVSRIMYRKFIGPLFSDLVINHKDGNRSNNYPSNLELVTQSKNNEHRFQVLNRPAVKGQRKVTDEQVLEIRKLKSQGWSLSKLARQFKIAKSTVSYIVNYKTFADVSDDTPGQDDICVG